MTDSDSGVPVEQKPGAPRTFLLRTLLPHVLTACIAVALTLGILALLPRDAAVSQSILAPSAAPTQPALPTPTSAPVTPQPTPQPLSEGVARQEIADLRAADDRQMMMIYLLKAVSQVAEAEQMLRSNDMSNVDQSLIAADYSLSLAYDRAEESEKSPIDQFRRNVDRMRGDLYLYPERMDLRLTQLRQFLLALIDNPR